MDKMLDMACSRAWCIYRLLRNKLHRVEIDLYPNLVVDLLQYLARITLELATMGGMYD